MWESQSTLWYFFSTLAQSAAAFEALIAVFVVFRLQAHSASVTEAYANASAWLQMSGYARVMDVVFSKDNVRKILGEIRSGVRASDNEEQKGVATQWIIRIKHLERFPKILGARTSVPMKLWGEVFFNLYIRHVVAELGRLVEGWSYSSNFDHGCFYHLGFISDSDVCSELPKRFFA